MKFLFILTVLMVLMTTPADAQVDRVINHTIDAEGGFSNHPFDAGGPTQYGITLASYQNFVNKNATQADLKRLTGAQARDFYKKYYFYLNNVDKLPNGIWDIMFDMVVNHGPKNAYLILQKALVKMGQKVAIDGSFGPRTREATEAANALADNPQLLRCALISQRTKFYSDIIKSNPSQKAFAAGWLNRNAVFVDSCIT